MNKALNIIVYTLNLLLAQNKNYYNQFVASGKTKFTPKAANDIHNK